MSLGAVVSVLRPLINRRFSGEEYRAVISSEAHGTSKQANDRNRSKRWIDGLDDDCTRACRER
jgi:hypothetical protein